AVFQDPRLADIQHLSTRILHPIDAGTRRQCLQRRADRLHAGIDVGLAAPYREGGLVFMKAVGRLGTRHDAEIAGGTRIAMATWHRRRIYAAGKTRRLCGWQAKDQVMVVFGQELTLPKHKHPFATTLKLPNRKRASTKPRQPLISLTDLLPVRLPGQDP